MDALVKNPANAAITVSNPILPTPLPNQAIANAEPISVTIGKFRRRGVDRRQHAADAETGQQRISASMKCR